MFLAFAARMLTASNSITPRSPNVTTDTKSLQAPFAIRSHTYPWTARVNRTHGTPRIDPEQSNTKMWWRSPVVAACEHMKRWPLITLEPSRHRLVFAARCPSCQAGSVQNDSFPFSKCSAASHLYEHILNCSRSSAAKHGSSHPNVFQYSSCNSSSISQFG